MAWIRVTFGSLSPFAVRRSLIPDLEFTVRLRPAILLLLAACGPSASDAADLILTNATVYTGDSTAAPAGAVAVKDGAIVYVGDADGAEALRGDATEVIDLTGRFVYPGFVDAHAHFSGIGQRELTLNLQGINSKDEFLAKVEEAVRTAPAGEWVTGRGWIETFWDPPVFPTRHDLDRIAPNNPVILSRADGHAAIANSAALRVAGITGATSAPPGGAINLDSDGEPTGMLIDEAQGLVGQHVPDLTEAQLERGLQLASERSARLGWTQIHDAHGSWNEVERMRRLLADDRIKVRLYKAISGPGDHADTLLARGPLTAEADGRLVVRTIKVVIDGALCSSPTAMTRPRAD